MSTDDLYIDKIDAMYVQDSRDARDALRDLCKESPYTFGYGTEHVVNGWSGYMDFMDDENFSVKDMLEHAAWECEFNEELNAFEMCACDDEEENEILYITLAPFILPGGSIIFKREDDTWFKLVFELGKVYRIPGEITFDDNKKEEL